MCSRITSSSQSCGCATRLPTVERMSFPTGITPRTKTLCSRNTRRYVCASSVASLVYSPGNAGVFAAVSSRRGFLPREDPLPRLPSGDFDVWENALADLPKLCVISGAGVLRSYLRSLPPFPLEMLEASTTAILTDSSPGPRDTAALWRAYLLLSYLSHAYVWCEDGQPPATSLPAVLAVPWVKVAELLSMPPVMVYAAYNLFNWRRMDPNRPIELGNIVSLQNFSGGMDEEWFRLVHVEIEVRAAAAVAQLPNLQQAVAQGDVDAVVSGLEAVSAGLVDMQASLCRMDEKCDPDVYFKRVRAPISGWPGNNQLAQGLVYEGVSDEPRQLTGATGAQSSVVPAFDAALGIQHPDGRLKQYLAQQRRHMPPAHRSFLAELEAGATPRLMTGAVPRVTSAYNDAVHQLEQFRALHMTYARRYISKFSTTTPGTGGLNVAQDLNSYRFATHASRV